MAAVIIGNRDAFDGIAESCRLALGELLADRWRWSRSSCWSRSGALARRSLGRPLLGFGGCWRRDSQQIIVAYASLVIAGEYLKLTQAADGLTNGASQRLARTRVLGLLVMATGLDSIVIKGAREHNLKNVDLVLPRNRLIVVTGLSGSGKSSLAFDTIYAEGQRRYVESLSSYARQFLGQMEKPDVDYIEGLSPAISIDQKSTSRNPRSTVGTVTEIYDYLRLLFARVGTPHCYNCGREISSQSSEQIVDSILELPEGTRIQLLAPLVRGRKGEYAKLFEEIAKEGFARVRVDGEIEGTAREDRARQEAQAHDRGRRRPPGDEARRSQAPDRFGRDDAAALHRHRDRARVEPTRPARELTFQRSVRVRLLRPLVRRARAAAVLVQLAVRRVPGVQRPRREDRDRSVEGDSRPQQVDRGRRDRAVEQEFGQRPLPVDESVLPAAARARAAQLPRRR